jgi:sugar/nucleoside kinase (ribokinase family)
LHDQHDNPIPFNLLRQAQRHVLLHVALILVAEDGENCIAVAGEANARLTSSDVRKAANAIRAVAVLVVQLETPLETVETTVTIAARAWTRTCVMWSQRRSATQCDAGVIPPAR